MGLSEPLIMELEKDLIGSLVCASSCPHSGSPPTAQHLRPVLCPIPRKLIWTGAHGHHYSQYSQLEMSAGILFLAISALVSGD